LLHPGFIDAHCDLTGLGMSMVPIDCKVRGMQIGVGGEVV
jgi:predicted amidohydrolase YtcJ